MLKNRILPLVLEPPLQWILATSRPLCARIARELVMYLLLLSSAYGVIGIKAR
jgi:hypothetical protein